MRIQAREPIQVYWNYQVHQLAEGEVVKGGLAEHLADNPRVEVLDPPVPAQQDGELDIDATIEAVLAWVGDDEDRAAQASVAESAKDKPRSTLLAKLHEMLIAN